MIKLRDILVEMSLPTLSFNTIKLRKEEEYYTEDNTGYEVRGYIKPESVFHTIREWENISREFLELQKQGYDVRGGEIGKDERLIHLVNKYFSYQLYIETELYDKHTKKMVLDFIEDFINHRIWTIREEYGKYLVNIENDKIAFFYSRGNIEPYVLLDEMFTVDTYGSADIEAVAYHWTSREGLKNIATSIQTQNTFSISCFTAQFKKFFRPESNILVKLKGHLVAAFQSDVKSFATDKGHRAANLFRFSFPEYEENICRDWTACKRDVTHLWNEIILTPTGILSYEEVNAVTEGVHDPVKPGILKKRLGNLSCSRVRAAKGKLKDKGTHYAKALQRYLNYHCQ